MTTMWKVSPSTAGAMDGGQRHCGRGDSRPPRPMSALCRHGGRRRARAAGPGNRIDLRRERVVLGGDVLAARNRLAVLRDLGRDLVAHDRQRIASVVPMIDFFASGVRTCSIVSCAVQPSVRSKYAMRLAPVDLLDELGAHVLVLEAQRVPGLVPHHAPELRFGRAHREAFEVEGRLVLLDAEDLRADIRPVARHVRRAVKPGDAHLPARGFLKLHIRGLCTRHSCAAGCRAGRSTDCRGTAR